MENKYTYDYWINDNPDKRKERKELLTPLMNKHNAYVYQDIIKKRGGTSLVNVILDSRNNQPCRELVDEWIEIKRLCLDGFFLANNPHHKELYGQIDLIAQRRSKGTTND